MQWLSLSALRSKFHYHKFQEYLTKKKINFSEERLDATEPLQNEERQEFVGAASSTNYGIFHQVSF